MSIVKRDSAAMLILMICGLWILKLSRICTGKNLNQKEILLLQGMATL